MPDTRCTPHGAYLCERCQPQAPTTETLEDLRDVLTELIALRGLQARVTELERRLAPNGCDHRLSNGLQCLLDAHPGNGHVYASSQTGDRHRDD